MPAKAEAGTTNAADLFVVPPSGGLLRSDSSDWNRPLNLIVAFAREQFAARGANHVCGLVGMNAKLHEGGQGFLLRQGAAVHLREDLLCAGALFLGEAPAGG